MQHHKILPLLRSKNQNLTHIYEELLKQYPILQTGRDVLDPLLTKNVIDSTQVKDLIKQGQRGDNIGLTCSKLEEFLNQAGNLDADTYYGMAACFLKQAQSLRVRLDLVHFCLDLLETQEGISDRAIRIRLDAYLCVGDIDRYLHDYTKLKALTAQDKATADYVKELKETFNTLLTTAAENLEVLARFVRFIKSPLSLIENAVYRGDTTDLSQGIEDCLQLFPNFYPIIEESVTNSCINAFNQGFISKADKTRCLDCLQSDTSVKNEAVDSPAETTSPQKRRRRHAEPTPTQRYLEARKQAMSDEGKDLSIPFSLLGEIEEAERTQYAAQYYIDIGDFHNAKELEYNCIPLESTLSKTFSKYTKTKKRYPDSAKQYLNLYQALLPPKDWHSQGKAYCLQGNFEKGIDYLSRLSKLMYPNQPSAIFVHDTLTKLETSLLDVYKPTYMRALESLKEGDAPTSMDCVDTMVRVTESDELILTKDDIPQLCALGASLSGPEQHIFFLFLSTKLTELGLNADQVHPFLNLRMKVAQHPYCYGGETYNDFHDALVVALDNVHCRTQYDGNYINVKEAITQDAKQFCPYYTLGPIGLAGRLFPWQLHALRLTLYAQDMGKTGLVIDNEVGLGKTITAISTIACDTEKKRHLIVVPLTVLDQWITQLKRFLPDATVLRYQGTGQTKDPSKYRIIVTTYNVLNRDSSYKKLASLHFDKVILDECQKVANMKSNSYGNIRGLNRNFLVPMSGTPIGNGLSELMSYFELLGLPLPYTTQLEASKAVSQRLTELNACIDASEPPTYDSLQTQAAFKDAQFVFSQFSTPWRSISFSLKKSTISATYSAITGAPENLFTPNTQELKYTYSKEHALVLKFLFEGNAEEIKEEFKALSQTPGHTKTKEKVRKAGKASFTDLIMANSNPYLLDSFVLSAHIRVCQRELKKDTTTLQRKAELEEVLTLLENIKAYKKNFRDFKLIPVTKSSCIIQKISETPQKKSVISVQWRENGPILQSGLEQIGVSAKVLNGSIPQPQRKVLLSQFTCTLSPNVFKIALKCSLAIAEELYKNCVLQCTTTGTLKDTSPDAIAKFKNDLLEKAKSSLSEPQLNLLNTYLQDLGFSVLILNMQMGNMGLNLEIASQLFFYDLWWNPAIISQMTGRLVRAMQTQVVSVFMPVGTVPDEVSLNFTVDKKMLAVIYSKRNQMRLLEPDKTESERWGGIINSMKIISDLNPPEPKPSKKRKAKQDQEPRQAPRREPPQVYYEPQSATGYTTEVGETHQMDELYGLYNNTDDDDLSFLEMLSQTF